MIKLRQLLANGFTLIEILITLTVVGILLGIIATFSITTLSQSSIEATRAELLSQSQIAMDRVINDTRLSAGAEQNNRWPDTNNVNGNLAWQSNSTSVVLATAVVDSANNIIFADPAKYISEKNNVIYFVQNKVLYKRVLASPVANNGAKTTCPAAAVSPTCPSDRALLKNVTSFTIKYLNGDEVEVVPSDARSIELTIKTSIYKFKRNISSDYTTRAVFRND
jgi:prepilin-type N-terminal cleavage/methylation domain-containing protein